VKKVISLESITHVANRELLLCIWKAHHHFQTSLPVESYPLSRTLYFTDQL